MLLDPARNGLQGYEGLALAVVARALADIIGGPPGSSLRADAEEFFSSGRACALCPLCLPCSAGCVLLEAAVRAGEGKRRRRAAVCGEV